MNFFSWGAAKITNASQANDPNQPKRTEVEQLITEFSNPEVDQDDEKKRDLLRRLLQLATHGFDTSKAFDQVILKVNTQDLISKKIMYQYITTYAKQHKDSALLTVNTLSRDCRNEKQPILRGLALRTLSSLHLPEMEDNIITLVKEGLNDASPFVRKTAVNAISKVYHLDPKLVIKEKMSERLYNMLKDKDPSVLLSSILAINEIEEESNGVLVTKKMLYYFLKRIGEFNEWELVIILKEMKKYKPKTNEEILDIMNILDDRLLLSNSAVILGIADLFLLYTESMPKIHQKVYYRLKEPLLLLCAASEPEITYTVLQHLKILVFREPTVFNDAFKTFFLTIDDPVFLKLLKLEILVLVADEKNATSIMKELRFHVTTSESTKSVSRSSIRAIGDVAVKLPKATEQALGYLFDFMEMEVDHIIAESFFVLKDILRMFSSQKPSETPQNPQKDSQPSQIYAFCESYLPKISKHWLLLNPKEYPDAFDAFIWILGEFGDLIEAAPYIIEVLGEEFASFENCIRISLLSSAMKLFFVRPPEMKSILASLLEQAVADLSSTDVHEKAAFYYNLLKTDPQMAEFLVFGEKLEPGKRRKRIGSSTLPNVSANSSPKSQNDENKVENEEIGSAKKAAIDTLFSEFNTLSISYGKPSETFTVREKTAPILGESLEEEEIIEPDEGLGLPEEQELAKQEEEEQRAQEKGVEDEEIAEYETKKTAKVEKSHNSKKSQGFNEKLLNFDEEEGGVDEFYDEDIIKLRPNPSTLSTKEYQEKWKSKNGPQENLPKILNDLSELEIKLSANGIVCLASNTKKKPEMFYFYAQEEDKNFILLQIKVFDQYLECIAKHDKENSKIVTAFITFVKSILKGE